MKNILLLLTFVLAAGLVTAQETAVKTCSKAETKACAKSGKVCAKTGKLCSKSATVDAVAENITESDASEANVLSALAEADLAAEEDEAIVRKECAKSGNVSYFRKAVCEKSGKVSMDEVKYCTKSQAFVNSSPSEVMSDVEAKVIKTADTVDGKVQSTEATKKKCCKGKKACGSKKKGA